MIQNQIKYYIDWLQRENYKSFYIAFLRVAISLWLLKEVCINWSSMDILYGKPAVLTKNHFTSRLPEEGFSFIKSHYIWFILPYIAVICLNILGIGRWFTAILLFVMVYTLQKMNISFVNNGDRAARLILLYLIFANSYQHFVLIKQKFTNCDKNKLQNLLSNLAAFSIMLLLCLAYFTSGLAKINDQFWRQGEATYYALLMERFMGTPFNKYIAQYRWVDVVSNYGAILFELLFPVLIWIKRLRGILLISGILFHLSIYIFLMIYGFQIVFVLIYGLFLPNIKLLNFAKNLQSGLRNIGRRTIG